MPKYILPPLPSPSARAHYQGPRNFSPGQKYNTSTPPPSPSTSPAPHLPTEILQTLFRNLDYYTLIRCQHVCASWTAALPGNYPVLASKLFTKSLDVHHADNDEDVPKPKFAMRLEAFTSHAEKALPKLRFLIYIKPTYFRKFDMSAGLKFHPIVKKLAWFMHLVNPASTFPEDYTKKQKNETEPYLVFDTLDELHRRVTSEEVEDGPWGKHLMCVPAIDCVQFTLRWNRESNVCTTVESEVVPEGVTVGCFLEMLREALQDAVGDVKKFARKVDVTSCERCADGYYSDYVEEEDSVEEESDED